MTAPAIGPDPQSDRLHALRGRLGYVFQREGLLEEALTHPSFQGEAGRRRQCNERMEFLGDRVLGLVIAELLFHKFPREEVGALARRHAALVRREALVQVADEIGLAACIRLSRGEEEAGGRNNPGLLSDACEALIAAIYLDGGVEPVRGFIERQFADLIEEARRTGAQAAFTEDYKSALQEWLQSRDRGLPVYRLAAEIGPAHRRVFDVEVLVAGEPVARAEGRSKKDAAQQAAKLALDALAKEG